MYRGVPAPERQAIRREALLDAAFDLLGREGWPATTVRAVCRRAGLTARYFYESFDDLDELLAAVFDRLVHELVAVVLEAVAQADEDAEAKAGAAIGAFVLHVTDDPRRARIAFTEALGSEVLARRRAAALHAFARLIAQQAREFYAMPDGDGTDQDGGGSDSIPETTAYLLAGGLAELLVAWLDGQVALTREQLIDDCTRLFVATGETALALARGRLRRRPAFAARSARPLG